MGDLNSALAERSHMCCNNFLPRDTTTELWTFLSTVPDYDVSQLASLKYVGFADYRGRTDLAIIVNIIIISWINKSIY